MDLTNIFQDPSVPFEFPPIFLKYFLLGLQKNVFWSQPELQEFVQIALKFHQITIIKSRDE